MVQYVDIIREDIADTNETGFAARAANALHIRTRQRVVEREVLLKPGMPYDSALAAETARNLRALGSSAMSSWTRCEATAASRSAS